MIRYYSTHNDSPLVVFREALFRGLAPDGGLYYPDRFPRMAQATLDALRGKPLPLVGAEVLTHWFEPEIAPAALGQIAADALHFPIPLRRVGDLYVLELFHGPTLAFKDIAAQTLPRLMSYFLQREARRITLLVATSGDTGGAIAHGFSDVPNIDVYVLYPKGRVSALQAEQLTRVASNITPIEIEGYFDDCQALVKQAFNDPSLAQLNLTSANSISIGRLIPQIIYYVYAYTQLGRDDIQFIVPSGNFGNLTGGLFARAMGVPLRGFIAATNRNDAVVDYYETGRYTPETTVATLSNAMDVGNPSNFARILELFKRDHAAFRAGLQAYRVDDATTIATQRAVYAQHGYLLDPHTAVGWHIAQQHGDPHATRVLVATASPVKFAAEIAATAGIAVDNAAALAALRTRPARRIALPNSYAALRDLLLTQHVTVE